MTTQPAKPTVIAGLSPDALSSMFQAIAGLHNFRATAAMLSGLLVGGLLAGAIVAVGGVRLVGVFVGTLLFCVFAFKGGGAATVETPSVGCRGTISCEFDPIDLSTCQACALRLTKSPSDLPTLTLEKNALGKNAEETLGTTRNSERTSLSDG
jgi:hypothetical protein